MSVAAKITWNRLQGKLDIDIVDVGSLEIESVCRDDYPDFCDAFISYGEFKDGTELNEDELDALNDEHGDLVYELAHESLY